MPNTRRWTARSTLTFIVLSLVAASLVAIVLTMSTSRIGTIKLPQNRLSISHERGPIYLGGHIQQACDAANARCRREVSGPRGSGTPLPSWELALAGLLAAGAAGFLWKTRRTQLDDSSQVSFSPESSPQARLAPGNPREMVLAAFADVEERLTRLGITREKWEAPESYLARAVPDNTRGGSPAGKLARLYALARYSRHPIDSSVAQQAESAAAELSASISPPPEPTQRERPSHTLDSMSTGSPDHG
jgi:hypothetical protein